MKNIIFLAIFITFSCSEDVIDFFYHEKINRDKYLDSTKSVVKIIFDYNQNMKDVNTLFRTSFNDLKTELNTNNAEIEAKGSNIAISLNKFLILTNRYDQLSKEIDTIISHMTALDQQINSDFEVNYIIDENKQSFHLDNFKMHQKYLKEAFQPIPSITEAMKKDNTFIRGVDLTFNNLYIPARILISFLENWIVTFKYCFQGVVTNDLRRKLTPENKHSDLVNINFIGSGLVDSKPTFYLELNILSNKIKYNSLIAIPYSGISLDAYYYYNTENQKIAKFITEDEKQLGLNEAITFCLKHINDKKFDLIIQYCPFISNTKLFQITNEGILLFKHDDKIGKAFVIGLQKDLNSSNYPVHIMFNGKLEFNLPHKGDVVIERQSNFKVISSSLTSDQRHLLELKVNDTRSNLEQATIIKHISNYFKNSYYQIFINIFVFTSIAFLGVGSKELYEKIKAHYKPRNSSKKLIINRLETIPLRSRSRR